MVLSRLVLEGESPHCLASLLVWGGGCSKALEEEAGSRVVWIIGGRTRCEVPDASPATARRLLGERG